MCVCVCCREDDLLDLAPSLATNSRLGKALIGWVYHVTLFSSRVVCVHYARVGVRTLCSCVYGCVCACTMLVYVCVCVCVGHLVFKLIIDQLFNYYYTNLNIWWII